MNFSKVSQDFRRKFEEELFVMQLISFSISLSKSIKDIHLIVMQIDLIVLFQAFVLFKEVFLQRHKFIPHKQL